MLVTGYLQMLTCQLLTFLPASRAKVHHQYPILRECVCERDREKESVCVCERDRLCLCVFVQVCVNEKGCARVCVYERVRVCVCERD